MYGAHAAGGIPTVALRPLLSQASPPGSHSPAALGTPSHDPARISTWRGFIGGAFPADGTGNAARTFLSAPSAPGRAAASNAAAAAAAAHHPEEGNGGASGLAGPGSGRSRHPFPAGSQEGSPLEKASRSPEAVPEEAAAHPRAAQSRGKTAGAGAGSIPGNSMRGSREGVNIHPLALVHPDAVLEEGVEVGPFCTVGPLVRLGRGCRLHASSHVAGDTEIGEQCVLFTGAVVGQDIPGQTRLGSHNKVGHYAVVGIRCQDMKHVEGSPCHLTVGSHNDIREYVQVHRSSRPEDCTVVGDHNLIMGGCHVAHDCRIGTRNILANNTLLAGHVVLSDFIHTGGAVAVHQFCHIDSFSFLAGGAMVTRDVPLYTMVSGDRAELRGLNLEGLRRCGFSTEEVRDIRKAYQRLFMSTDELLGFEERLRSVEESPLGTLPRVKALLDSIRGSFTENRRGICKFRHWSSAVDV